MSSPQHWTVTYDKSPVRKMQVQQQYIGGSPHRRLNVIPNRVCTQCLHMRRDEYTKEIYWCKAGDISTSPVTGRRSYLTTCKSKNTDGDCADFLDRSEHDAEVAAKQKKNLRIVNGAIACILTAFIGLLCIL